MGLKEALGDPSICPAVSPRDLWERSWVPRVLYLDMLVSPSPHSKLSDNHIRLTSGNDHSHWPGMQLGSGDEGSVCGQGCAVAWVCFLPPEIPMFRAWSQCSRIERQWDLEGAEPSESPSSGPQALSGFLSAV